MNSADTLKELLRAREIYLAAREQTIKVQRFEELACDYLSKATSKHERTVMKEGKKNIAF